MKSPIVNSPFLTMRRASKTNKSSYHFSLKRKKEILTPQTTMTESTLQDKTRSQQTILTVRAKRKRSNLRKCSRREPESKPILMRIKQTRRSPRTKGENWSTNQMELIQLGQTHNWSRIRNCSSTSILKSRFSVKSSTNRSWPNNGLTR